MGCIIKVYHRKWIENVNPKYRYFKEGYNCFAIENEKELAGLIRKDPDTIKIVQNAKNSIIVVSDFFAASIAGVRHNSFGTTV